jgi:hypothetical protein
MVDWTLASSSTVNLKVWHRILKMDYLIENANNSKNNTHINYK